MGIFPFQCSKPKRKWAYINSKSNNLKKKKELLFNRFENERKSKDHEKDLDFQGTKSQVFIHTHMSEFYYFSNCILFN